MDDEEDYSGNFSRQLFVEIQIFHQKCPYAFRLAQRQTSPEFRSFLIIMSITDMLQNGESHQCLCVRKWGGTDLAGFYLFHPCWGTPETGLQLQVAESG